MFSKPINRVSVMYRMVGNFHEFRGYSWKFPLRNFGAWCPLAPQKRAIYKSFLRENCIFHQFVKAPSKVCRYTVLNILIQDLMRCTLKLNTYNKFELDDQVMCTLTLTTSDEKKVSEIRLETYNLFPFKEATCTLNSLTNTYTENVWKYFRWI